jgi:branched-chain amino acid transport system substrate-binding protein
MRRIVAAALAAACLVAAGTAGAGTKIGMITTLSGPAGYLGGDMRDGFMLALKQSGRTDIEVIVKDDGLKPDIGKQLSDEMMQKDKVDLMTGIIFSNVAMAVVPAAVKHGMIYISPNAGPSALAGKLCDRNYFNVAWQNDDLHAAMGAYMKGAGVAKPFILAPNYPAGKDALTGFKRGYGADPVSELYTKVGQTDYAAEIAQIRASGADSVFFFLPGGMGIAFLKQYAAAGVGLPVYGPAFSFDEKILKAVGDAALGVKYTSQWAYDLDNPANVAFVASYQAEYGHLPTLYASQGFDAANLILSALAKADVKDAGAFRKALEAADFSSVRGAFKFNTNHHPIQNIYVREVVKGVDGAPTNKLVGLAEENHHDAYAGECKM